MRVAASDRGAISGIGRTAIGAAHGEDYPILSPAILQDRMPEIGIDISKR